MNTAARKREVKEELNDFWERTPREVNTMMLFVTTATARLLASRGIYPDKASWDELAASLVQANAPFEMPYRRIGELLRELLLAETADALGLESYDL